MLYDLTYLYSRLDSMEDAVVSNVELLVNGGTVVDAVVVDGMDGLIARATSLDTALRSLEM